MTQDEFNSMMDAYLSNLKNKSASSWSADAREWAEAKGLIKGDTSGNKSYKNFATREEVASILYTAHTLLGNLKFNDNQAYSDKLALTCDQMKILNASIEKLAAGETPTENNTLLEQINAVNDKMEDLYGAIRNSEEDIYTSMSNQLEAIQKEINNQNYTGTAMINATNNFNNLANAIKKIAKELEQE